MGRALIDGQAVADGETGPEASTTARNVDPDLGRDVVRDVVRDDTCFCCGRDNQHGLKLRFSYDGEGTAETCLKVPDWFSGWKRMTHGGLLSMLLDEAMAHACISILGHAITAELTVRYHTPVETGTSISIKGTVEAVRSKIVETSGIVLSASGETVATGKARFLRVDSG